MWAPFLPTKPTVEDYWRSIVLFGANVASYKFALAKSLLEIRPQSGRLLKLDELAGPFSRHIVQHLKNARQGQFESSAFLSSCKEFIDGKIDQHRLVEKTVRHGFVNVIDAFHVVNRAEISIRFFVDERATNGGIRITDEYSRLLDGTHVADLPQEAEARWRLVETAWDLRVARSVLTISHDPGTESFYAVDSQLKRRSVTSVRGALNGYQKGYCFYCFGPIHISSNDEPPHVDHFFPHALKQAKFRNLDGVWNLVLACQLCNCGPGGKWALVPSEKFLDRLHRRNEYLIQSHHPLRETLRGQTGTDEPARRAFLNAFHANAVKTLIHQWQVNAVSAEMF